MKKEEKTKTEFPGYPVYPASEDIYNQSKEEKEINPEDISKIKQQSDDNQETQELDFTIDKMGGDLDVPGSELDDENELTGNEDEENNFYSLGGDEHEN